MKYAKDRVLAIDYFRGLCITVILLSHSQVFSLPFAYISGLNQLWTSAAEMFFLLSGITYAIVRGPRIVTDFKTVVRKTYRRAFIIYLANALMAVTSICLALLLIDHHLNAVMPQAPPNMSSASLLARILTLSYSYGWANFLMYYGVFLLLAPFALHALYRYKRLWLIVPAVSIAVFLAYASRTNGGAYSPFAIWQVYFFMGMTIARFRQPLIGWFGRLKPSVAKGLATGTVVSAAAMLALSFLLNFNVYPRVVRLVAAGWLPLKLQTAYAGLLAHRQLFDNLLMNSRTGVLRPAAALLTLLAAYLVYQKYKNFLLRFSGRFFNTLGRDTLWLFAAQALAIPLLAALPVSRDLVNNIVLTASLFGLMWAIAQHRAAAGYLKAYFGELKTAFYQAKYAAMSQRDSA